METLWRDKDNREANEQQRERKKERKKEKRRLAINNQYCWYQDEEKEFKSIQVIKKSMSRAF